MNNQLENITSYRAQNLFYINFFYKITENWGSALSDSCQLISTKTKYFQKISVIYEWDILD